MCKSYEREKERQRERDGVKTSRFDGILKTLIFEEWEVNQLKPCPVGDVFQGKLNKW